MLLALLLGALTVTPHADDSLVAKRATAARTKLVTRDSLSPARGMIADRILVEKKLRRLTLIKSGVNVARYQIALGRNPVGDKERRGDMRTPEGLYTIDARVERSKYHLALRISYPSADDIDHANSLGVSPGGDIMIHGLPNGRGSVGAAHREFDWTEGCIAVTNEEIEEIWRAVPLGTVIEIRP